MSQDLPGKYSSFVLILSGVLGFIALASLISGIVPEGASYGVLLLSGLGSLMAWEQHQDNKSSKSSEETRMANIVVASQAEIFPTFEGSKTYRGSGVLAGSGGGSVYPRLVWQGRKKFDVGEVLMDCYELENATLILRPRVLTAWSRIEVSVDPGTLSRWQSYFEGQGKKRCLPDVTPAEAVGVEQKSGQSLPVPWVPKFAAKDSLSGRGLLPRSRLDTGL